MPPHSRGVVCFGAAIESALLFAATRARDLPQQGAVVVAAARLEQRHFAISACTGGTVVALDTAAEAGLLTVLAVIRVDRPATRHHISKQIEAGRASGNKAVWEQSPGFTREFGALLTHLGEVPAGWQLGREFTWVGGHFSRAGRRGAMSYVGM